MWLKLSQMSKIVRDGEVNVGVCTYIGTTQACKFLFKMLLTTAVREN